MRLGLSIDTPVLRGLPNRDEIVSHKSFLQKVTSAVGGQEWMWKSISGGIIAIIVLPPQLYSIADYWEPKISAGIELAEPYLQALREIDFRPTDTLIGFDGQGDEKKGNEFVIPHAVAPTADPAPDGKFRIYKLLPNRLDITSLGNVASFLRSGQPPYEDFIRVLKYENRSPTEWTDGSRPVTFFATDLLALVEEWRHWQMKWRLQNNLGDPKATLRIAECDFSGRVETLPTHIESGVQGQWYVEKWVRSGQAELLLVPSSRGKVSEMALLYQSKKNIEQVEFLKVHEITTHLANIT